MHILYPYLSKIAGYLRKRLGIVQMREKLELQEKRILELQIALLKTTSNKFQNEANYMHTHAQAVIPYKKIQIVPDIESGFDSKLELPFVIHNGNRLYFPHEYALDHCVEMYRDYIGTECLLGGNYREKQPHQYLTDSFNIEEGDVLVDVGCAEALLSLDSIERVSKVYLFEADTNWLPALKATFKNHSEKIVLINKYVSGEDSETTISLATALQNEHGKKLFIKMDIEGAELEVLKGSKDFLAKRDNVKLICCTYHRHDDESLIPALIEEMGYSYEFSDGFMFFKDDPDFKYPYLRHGLIRAKNF